MTGGSVPITGSQCSDRHEVRPFALFGGHEGGNGGTLIQKSGSDEWATAQIAGVAPFTGQGTTGAVVGDDIVVVMPHFADPEPPTFERVSLR